MSWSIGASGSKYDVHKMIDLLVSPALCSPEQAMELERARQACHLLVDSLTGNSRVSINAYGSATGAVTVNLSGYDEQVKPEDAQGAAAPRAADAPKPGGPV